MQSSMVASGPAIQGLQPGKVCVRARPVQQSQSCNHQHPACSDSEHFSTWRLTGPQQVTNNKATHGLAAEYEQRGDEPDTAATSHRNWHHRLAIRHSD
eukprot:1143893-Pelagomonas_calceolata.AAC.20